MGPVDGLLTGGEAVLFGTLPSSCLAQALNMEIRITVDGAFTEELW